MLLPKNTTKLAVLTLVFFSVNVTGNTTHPWLAIDNFEDPNSISSWEKADTRNDTSPKVEEPQVTERRVDKATNNAFLIKKPAAEGVVGNRKALSYKKLPQAVPVGATYTFFTRINVEYFPNNHVFGLSDMHPAEIKEHDYNAFEPSLRVTDKRESSGLKNDGTLMVKTEKGYSKIFNFKEDRYAAPLETGVWYDVWYVVNNAKKDAGGQRYDVYIKGGKEFPQQTLVYQNAVFRMSREKPLVYFLTNCNTGPKDKPYGNGGLLYDDIYMSNGINLSSPI